MEITEVNTMRKNIVGLGMMDGRYMDEIIQFMGHDALKINEPSVNQTLGMYPKVVVRACNKNLHNIFCPASPFSAGPLKVLLAIKVLLSQSTGSKQ